MAKLIDGKAVSASVRAQVAQEVQELKAKGLHPGLAVVIVGDDPASRTYVNNKKKACAETGIYSEEYALPATTTQEELLSLVRSLNEKPEIHGILVQSPLPEGLDEEAVIKAAAKTGKIVTVEEHSVIGGLGSAVCDVVAEKAPAKVMKIGINDTFGESGPAVELIKKYGLDSESIYTKVKEFLK